MAKFVSQFTFKTPNRPGVLAEIAKAMGKNKINILSICSCGEGKRGEVTLSTTNNPKAKPILKKLGYRPKEHKYITLNVTNRPGRLAPILNRLAKARVNVTSCLFTSGNAKSVGVLLNTNKNKKVARML